MPENRVKESTSSLTRSSFLGGDQMISVASRSRVLSQAYIEIHNDYASHKSDELHCDFASQSVSEFHLGDASQYVNEIQCSFASHSTDELHNPSASHKLVEIHREYASHTLSELHLLVALNPEVFSHRFNLIGCGGRCVTAQ